MLKTIEKTIQVSSGSRIGDIEARGFNGTINSVDPLEMGISAHICDYEAYRANIKQCREDENAFREYMQALQDELLAAQEAGTEKMEDQDGEE